MKITDRKKYIKLIVLVCLMAAIVSVNIKCVYALMWTDPVKSLDGYNETTKYPSNSTTCGCWYDEVTVDSSKLDVLKFSYEICFHSCGCGNSSFPESNYVRLYLDDNVIHTYTTHSKRITDEIDLKNYRKSNLKIKVEWSILPAACQKCGTTKDSYLAYPELVLYDMRGSADMGSTQIDTTLGGVFNIQPAYNAYAEKYEWGIRLPGESVFTKLKEGSNNPLGITVSGVSSRYLSVANTPYAAGGFDLGVAIKDKDNNYPALTTAVTTPYFTHINVIDNVAPSIEVKKTIDKSSGTVIAKIVASDSGGLHGTPYSWDGCSTFGTSDTNAFSAAGTYYAGVRDASGNTAVAEFTITSAEIQKASPQGSGGGNEGTPNVPDSTVDSDTTTGGITTPQSGTDTPNADDINGINTGGLPNGPGQTGVYTVSEGVPSIKPSGKDSNTQNTGSTGADGAGSDESSGLNAKKLSDKDSYDVFEKIRNNSKDYVISMQEVRAKENMAMNGQENEDINPESIESDENAPDFTNGSENDLGVYNPEKQKLSGIVIALIVFLIIMLTLLLMFILFFGVIILSEKETEFSKVSETGGIKLPVALSLISYKDGQFGINFRGLLEKYDVLYARCGILFAYLFENEKIQIMTKFKGSKKRVIATETIHKEIIVGSKGGNKK